MVSVLASERCEILFLEIQRVFTVCSPACGYHSRLIRNLLTIMARKNLMLTRKIDHMSQRTIREKVMAYLSCEAERWGNEAFEIPAGGLSGGGPERPIGRAFQDAERRTY